ncbi:lysylphosphatidylglycerol synthase transmembrane domain-containing protein [Arthrobacter flavus]|uniref:Lysylphosphatidylglycerol synthase transmembrane domain-containing protein n=1 Tax=Arthrobacter flavus TaxID=95172 RepID=A0ABW4QAU2_9MICC
MRRRRWLALLQVLCAVALMYYLVTVFGTGPFTAGLGALTLPSVTAALALGLIGTAAQAQRWRLVSSGFQMHLPRGGALAQCYEASFLNAVLPGGLAGDAIRTARQRSAHRSNWLSSIGSVLGERLAGTVIVLLAAAAALLTADWRLAAVVAAGAVLVLLAARPSLRRLPSRTLAAVWALSVLGWASFVALFAVSAALTAPHLAVADVVGLAAICLAGMSIPLSLGGWGPREGVTALAFMMFGYSGALGVEVSVGYGLLALVSVLPGAVLLLVLAIRGFLGDRGGNGGREVELGADVPAELETPDRRGEGV